MKQTRRGVYINLDDSPHIIKHNGFIFRFSSRAKLRKYDSEVKLKTIQIVNSIKRVFKDDYYRVEKLTNQIIDLLYLTIYHMTERK